MQITVRDLDPCSVPADLLVVAGRVRGRDPIVAELDRATGRHLRAFLGRRRFTAASGSSVLYQAPPKTLAAEYVLLVGPDRDSSRTSRLLADQAVNRGRELQARRVVVVAPTAEAIEPLAETLHLAAYQFQGLKGRTGKRPPSIEAVTIIGPSGARSNRALRRGRALAQAACLARDLVNGPAHLITPSRLAAEARRIGRQQRLIVRIRRAAELRRLGMGALLGVSRGSQEAPCFIEVIYRPRGAKRRVALVGKGITFDSGGLSLKSAESMQTQKRDMAGGAVVLAVMSVVRDLGIGVEVRAYVPATENMPSGSAIKPGDVVTALNGKTIEVLNTDAEGRLVLADGLSYAVRAKPDVVIDFATLTAAVRTALGPRYAAIMSSDPRLRRELIEAAAASGENLWELPLVEDYRRDLDSTVADLKNTGEGHSGTIIGGLFLREFTAGLPWAHVDFSSTVVTEKPFPGHPRGASGFGVRTLLRYLLAAGAGALDR